MTSKTKSGSGGKDNPLEKGLLWLAKKLEQMGKVDKALQIYTYMIKSNPKCVSALFRRCMIWLYQGEDAKATTDAAKACSAAPRDPRGLCARGIIQVFEENFDGALKEFKKALELPEWDSVTCIFVYLLTNKLANADDAKEFLNNAVDNKIRVKEWPFPILQYWRGHISITDLMAFTSSDNGKLLETRAYLGFLKALSKYPLEGKPDLQFVNNSPGGSPLVKALAMQGLDMVADAQDEDTEAKKKRADKTAGMDWMD
jgi:tetratricopeptide (TPR) repeat protein